MSTLQRYTTSRVSIGQHFLFSFVITVIFKRCAKTRLQHKSCFSLNNLRENKLIVLVVLKKSKKTFQRQQRLLRTSTHVATPDLHNTYIYGLQPNV